MNSSYQTATKDQAPNLPTSLPKANCPQLHGILKKKSPEKLVMADLYDSLEDKNHVSEFVANGLKQDIQSTACPYIGISKPLPDSKVSMPHESSSVAKPSQQLSKLDIFGAKFNSRDSKSTIQNAQNMNNFNPLTGFKRVSKWYPSSYTQPSKNPVVVNDVSRTLPPAQHMMKDTEGNNAEEYTPRYGYIGTDGQHMSSPIEEQTYNSMVSHNNEDAIVQEPIQTYSSESDPTEVSITSFHASEKPEEDSLEGDRIKKDLIKNNGLVQGTLFDHIKGMYKPNSQKMQREEPPGYEEARVHQRNFDSFGSVNVTVPNPSDSNSLLASVNDEGVAKDEQAFGSHNSSIVNLINTIKPI